MFVHKEVFPSQADAEKESMVHEALVLYSTRNPDQLSVLEKSVNGFSYADIQRVCDTHPLMAVRFKEAIAYARAYAASVLRIEELSECAQTDEACRDEWDLLVTKQSEDKNFFIQSLRELSEDMQDIGIADTLSPFLDRGSVFNSQLALYVAFKSLS